MRRLPRSLAVLLLPTLLLALTACGGAGDDAGGSTAPRFARYVALGDSYTAAPYVPQSDVAQGCVRSDGNYPSILAKAVGVGTLVDVSCSGADTTDLVSRQKTFKSTSVPAQDDALNARTDLVTLGIGGNDQSLFSELFTLCSPGASVCSVGSSRPSLVAKLTALGPRLTTTLQQVRAKAPNAKVLLVGYPKLAPDSGTCATLPPLDAASLTVFNQANLQLDQEMQQAAKATGVTYVDVYSASLGHDICSKEPWVNGIRTDTSAALALHPFAREQAAVAKLIEQQLG